jgi:hypothetical protein
MKNNEPLTALFWEVRDKSVKNSLQVKSSFYNTNDIKCFPFNKPISKIINLSSNASLERK